MKLLICLLIILVACHTSIAQNPTADSAKYQAAKKSKTQRTTGIVLLSAGGAIAIVGYAIGINNFPSDLPDMVVDNKQLSGTGALVTGMAMMVASIPFFVLASQNRRASLAVLNVPQWQMDTGLLTLRSKPQLSLTLTQQIF